MFPRKQFNIVEFRIRAKSQITSNYIVISDFIEYCPSLAETDEIHRRKNLEQKPKEMLILQWLLSFKINFRLFHS